MCCPLLFIGVGLCFGGEGDGEGAFGVGVGVEGARDDVEHAVLAIADEGEEVYWNILVSKLQVFNTSISKSGALDCILMLKEYSHIIRYFECRGKLTQQCTIAVAPIFAYFYFVPSLWSCCTIYT